MTASVRPSVCAGACPGARTKAAPCNRHGPLGRRMPPRKDATTRSHDSSGNGRPRRIRYQPEPPRAAELAGVTKPCCPNRRQMRRSGRPGHGGIRWTADAWTVTGPVAGTQREWRARGANISSDLAGLFFYFQPAGQKWAAHRAFQKVTNFAMAARAVVIYDGVCNLCNGGVRWLAKRDPGARIHYCALQSSAAGPILREAGLSREDVHRRFALIEGRLDKVQGDAVERSGVPPSPSWTPGEPRPRAEVPGTRLTAHRASKAALRAAALASSGGGPAWLGAAAAVGELVPVSLRDAVYDVVAQSRYSVFGRTDVCQLPPTGLTERFLDGHELASGPAPRRAP